MRHSKKKPSRHGQEGKHGRGGHSPGGKDKKVPSHMKAAMKRIAKTGLKTDEDASTMDDFFGNLPV